MLVSVNNQKFENRNVCLEFNFLQYFNYSSIFVAFTISLSFYSFINSKLSSFILQTEEHD